MSGIGKSDFLNFNWYYKGAVSNIFYRLFNNSSDYFTNMNLNNSSLSIHYNNYNGENFGKLSVYDFLLIFYLSILVVWTISKILKLNGLIVSCEVLFVNITLIITMPIIVSFHGLNHLIRILISIYFRIMYGDKIKLMKGADAFWALEKYAQACHFTSLYIVEGKCNLEKIQQRFLNQLIMPLSKDNGRKNICSNRLTRRVTRKLGYFCWEKIPELFDIKNHVRFLDESPKKMKEGELLGEMAKNYNSPLPSENPPWVVDVVNEFVYDDSTDDHKTYYALMFRIGHQLMDGISAGLIIDRIIADDHPIDENLFDPLKPPKIPLKHNILNWIHILTYGPRTFFKSVYMNESNSLHHKSLTGPKHIGWTRPFLVKDFRKVKIRTETSTTSILINSVGGSLKALAKRNKLTDMKGRIHAATTVAIFPYEKLKPQNRFTLSLYPLEMPENINRIQHLKLNYKEAMKFSQAPNLTINYVAQRLIGRLPVPALEYLINTIHSTVLVSNVPGPAGQLFLFGDLLKEAIGWVPLKGKTGIGVSFFSYNGRLRGAFVVDEATGIRKEDLNFIIRHFEQEIDHLFKLHVH